MMTTTTSPSTYRPVPLQTLRAGAGPDCSLFLARLDEHGDRQHVLLRDSARALRSTHRERLLENNITEIYVRSSEYGRYARYLEGHLGQVLRDPKLPDHFKGELLADISRELIADGFADPTTPKFVGRVSNLSSQMVSFASKGNELLGHLVDALDTTYDLRGHAINVCVYSLSIALEARIFTTRQLRDIAMGALLHDIGKTRVPVELLERPDALTADELAVVRRNVELGESLLLEANDDLRSEVLQPISLHHEALNGAGYPRRLKADRISPEGRIVAIANMFDSLTTSRPYREPVTAFEALSLMKNEFAGRYDQDLMVCFIRRLAILSQ